MDQASRATDWLQESECVRSLKAQGRVVGDTGGGAEISRDGLIPYLQRATANGGMAGICVRRCQRQGVESFLCHIDGLPSRFHECGRLQKLSGGVGGIQSEV